MLKVKNKIVKEIYFSDRTNMINLLHEFKKLHEEMVDEEYTDLVSMSTCECVSEQDIDTTIRVINALLDSGSAWEPIKL